MPAHSSAAATERRVCSIFFCDLVGFTPISEARDPEEVRELLSRYFDVARTLIGRYGGVVEKFIGDAVMAVWGAPIASDGDAERAVRAALDVVDAVRELGRESGVERLAARAGVVTGEVAVTVGATGQGMVAGDAVNTAARVQTAAEPGTVLVDEGTWRVARGAISFDDIGDHLLKGKAEPIRLWRAERVLSGVGGTLRVDGLEAPMVGRDAELRLMKELFHACVDRRMPRLVSVTGPAGVGKSRLGWEFFKYVDGLKDIVWWHRGRCLSYGDGVAFWALAEMVRQRFGIAEEDSTTTTAEKLTAGLAQWVPDRVAHDYVAPRLAQLLGVGADGVAFNGEELFAGWRVFFESLAAKDPVVLLLEDVQYADTGLLDFIEHLLDWARDVPILVVTLARPELADRRPGWGMGRRNGTALALDPLDDTAMRAMLEGLVPGMPDAAAVAIARQAQGIPLYAVETVRMLVDRDVVQPIDGVYRLVGDMGELAVPDTLQSLLAARLDSLDPATRRLVADAAVLGGSFPIEALIGVSGLAAADVQKLVAELVRREVLAVRTDPLSPDRGQYAFVQTMFRQVAYDTLSRRERKVRHLQVAEHLVRTFADGGEEVSEVVAQHLLDALAAVPDDVDVPEIRDRAVNALVRAAERAERTGAHATASAALIRAADLLQDEESERGDLAAAGLLERAGQAAGTASDQQASASYGQRAAELYERRHEVVKGANARSSVGAALRRSGQLDESRRVLKEALSALDGHDGAATVLTLEELALAELIAGRGDDAQKWLHDALALAQRIRLEEHAQCRLLVTAGMCAGWSNQRLEAIAFLREAIRRAEIAQDHRNLIAASLNLADTVAGNDPATAVDVAKQAVARARLVGNRFLLPTAVSNMVQAQLLTGEWDDAEKECRQEIAGDRADEMIGYPLVLLHALRGQTDELDDFVAMFGATPANEDEQRQASYYLVRAFTAMARGDSTAARAHAQQVLDLAPQIGCAHEATRWAWFVAAESAAGKDALDDMGRLLEWLEPFPVGHLAEVQVLDRDRVRAKLLGLRGDPGATAAFEEAVVALRKFGSPLHLALGLLDQAEFLERNGADDHARAAATEAAQLGEQLRSAPIQRRAAAIAGETPATEHIAAPYVAADAGTV
ncbi:MAG TPA: adenylate/guanylate cyclase domain-containing protein [Mycobacteriales bacterium]|nr:adenylate/guanylate cyclase domain-containing protein [Mycobacteriales bacterium]